MLYSWYETCPAVGFHTILSVSRHTPSKWRRWCTHISTGKNCHRRRSKLVGQLTALHLRFLSLWPLRNYQHYVATCGPSSLWAHAQICSWGTNDLRRLRVSALVIVLNILNLNDWYLIDSLPTIPWPLNGHLAGYLLSLYSVAINVIYLLTVVLILVDKQYVLKKCPYLLNEMISVAHQLFVLSQAERGSRHLFFSSSQTAAAVVLSRG